jgi:hypothetical protein
LSRLGTRVPADPNEVEHHLVAEWCVAVSAQFVVLRTVVPCPVRCSCWSSALEEEGSNNHHTFTFGLSRMCSLTTCGLCQEQCVPNTS